MKYRFLTNSLIVILIVGLFLIHFFVIPLIGFVKVTSVDNDALSEGKEYFGAKYQIEFVQFIDGLFIRKSDKSQWELWEGHNSSLNLINGDFHKCGWLERDDNTVEILMPTKRFRCSTFDPLIVIPLKKEIVKANHLTKIFVLKKYAEQIDDSIDRQSNPPLTSEEIALPEKGM